ncbi:MAG: hypothetical protein PHG24_00910 [Candidatus Pacebacteria bacterium]|nr:hypothetical protein [Candidatus Paceibacterota bacterium]
MAIDFTKNQENKIFSNKFFPLGIILLVGILVFIFFKTGAFSSQNEIVGSEQMFQPINIDFEFLNSEEFQSLEKFSGIPVLSGFFSASDTEIDPEVIEPGRDNPFESVSSSEIELAVTKVILKIDTFEGIEEMKLTIENSTLYTAAQKKSLLKKLDEQNEMLIKLNEPTPEEIETPSNEENTPPEVVEEEPEAPQEEIDYYKEW